MTIFFYKGLSRKQENGNTPVWVLPNIWRLEWVRDTKFYWMLLPFLSYYGKRNKERGVGVGVKLVPLHTQIRVKLR